MKKNPVNILLIGFGHHARRIYYPIYQRDNKTHNFTLVYGVDLKEKKKEIESYLKKKKDYMMQMYYIDSRDKTYDELSPNVKKKLNEIVKRYNIRGIILSTEPLSHMLYARWAMRKGLSILMDKPISTKINVSTSESAANEIIIDYDELIELYKKSKEKYGRVIFSVMTQRRYHPVFRKVKELINEVSRKTNCPVTSIQSFHSDGQWWLPEEIVKIDYHPHNLGYGKCSHSGYHFFDIIPWLLEAAENPDKKINNVDVFTNFLRPLDFIKQLNLKDYERLFPYFINSKKYNESELETLYEKYGEIDAFSSFAFKHYNRTMTLGSINLVHNGFSQRGWLSIKGRDLYKGNGRVRQESHFIEQGPFQSISIKNGQSK